MRWGIKDDSLHITTKLCLDEIKRAQKESIGANFVVRISMNVTH
jgi:hypothetical protein